MKSYRHDPAWADVTPSPQEETLNPLAAIAYTDEYSEAMSYLRAVMATNEYSQRSLALTEHIIEMNPAHYTVWLFRAKALSEMKTPLADEISWLNPIALAHLKNYQIWNHRQTVVDQLGSQDGESDFVAKMLQQDSKNYHVWSYRQWLVQRFDLFHDEKELQWTETVIEQDVRNNSAWNHRFFLIFGSPTPASAHDVVEREIEYAKTAIRKAPQNQSPWSFMRGVLREAKLPTSTIKEFLLEFADLEKPDDVSSSHALDALADMYAHEQNKSDANKVLHLLSTRYDPIRAHYWNYRKTALGPSTAAA